MSSPPNARTVKTGLRWDLQPRRLAARNGAAVHPGLLEHAALCCLALGDLRARCEAATAGPSPREHGQALPSGAWGWQEVGSGREEQRGVPRAGSQALPGADGVTLAASRHVCPHRTHPLWGGGWPRRPDQHRPSSVPAAVAPRPAPLSVCLLHCQLLETVSPGPIPHPAHCGPISGCHLSPRRQAAWGQGLPLSVPCSLHASQSWP